MASVKLSKEDVAQVPAAIVQQAAVKTFTYTTKKLLTRPTISMKAEGAECFIKIEAPMYEGRQMKDNGTNPKEPATILDVINLVTGEEAQLVVPAMLKSTLSEGEDYENDGYVGKCFHLKNLGKQDAKAAGGQRYNRLLIEEIEV